jgi:hypothetical protein
LDWTFGTVWVGVEPRIKVRVGVEPSRVRVTIWMRDRVMVRANVGLYLRLRLGWGQA